MAYEYFNNEYLIKVVFPYAHLRIRLARPLHSHLIEHGVSEEIEATKSSTLETNINFKLTDRWN